MDSKSGSVTGSRGLGQVATATVGEPLFRLIAKGEIDRRVVAIMKKWGMAWGGDWSYTDPMHFEMSSVVRPG